MPTENFKAVERAIISAGETGNLEELGRLTDIVLVGLGRSDLTIQEAADLQLEIDTYESQINRESRSEYGTQSGVSVFSDLVGEGAAD